MDWKRELKIFGVLAAVFLAVYYLPVGTARFDVAVSEGLQLLKWYAREHVVLCLLPAFFIAGAISVFVSQASVMKYLGTRAHPVAAYGVASVSGTILAVCSCTVLPLFGGIYKRGAGLGPATAFLYSGPAINVLAIVLTARVLGLEMGIARTIGAVVFSVLIGILMHLIFRKEEKARSEAAAVLPEVRATRPLWQTVLTFAAMVAVLVFANWGKSADESGVWQLIFSAKWILTSFAAAFLGVALVVWHSVKLWKAALAAFVTFGAWLLVPQSHTAVFAVGTAALSWVALTTEGEMRDWFFSSWDFAKQITPLLLAGVLAAGFLLGRPGEEGLIPSAWITSLVGGNSAFANFFASFVGAFMYFATLTEIPILQGLIGSGMGKGPALALLLAGPALSLPSMLVLRSIMGMKKTVAYVALVVVMATATGMIYGIIGG